MKMPGSRGRWCRPAQATVLLGSELAWLAALIHDHGQGQAFALGLYSAVRLLIAFILYLLAWLLKVLVL